MDHLHTIAHACADARTVLIDGRSGSGKTTFAAALARLTGHEVIHLDDFYPGWWGLIDAMSMVAHDVLHPTHPGYQRWNWGTNTPGEWVNLDPERLRIVEGVGAVSEASIRAAQKRGKVVSIRLHLDAQTRKQRALTRDPAFADWWDVWAAQEDARVEQLPVDYELG